MSTSAAGRPLQGWRLRDDNPNEWTWTPRATRRHDLGDWLPVAVPAAVQTALQRAGRIRDPYRDLHSRAAEWIEHRDWIYGCDFPLAPPAPGRRVFLDFESVDDRCRVFLNGAQLAEHEGPGAPFHVEIGPALQEPDNQLLVVLAAAPPEDPQTGWTDHTRSLKGRMGFGWDFAPRLVRTGILGPVRLRETGAHRLDDLWARAQLAPDYASATVALEVRVDGPPGAEVRVSVRRGRRVVATPEAVTVADGVARIMVVLEGPDLWWPNGLGTQPLYTATATCVDGADQLATTFGVRDLQWVGRPDGPPEEWPLTMVVNGRRVFHRGWNWVPADTRGGPVADRQAARLLALAQAAGANVLRCWGGGDPETAAFYDACDRRGLLVWQELPLSSGGISNVPPSDPGYLDRAAAYAAAVMAARRNHPSLALWGGGNELMGADGRPLTPEHPYAARLHAVTATYDPDRTFRPSSPLGPVFDADPEQGPLWDVHGSWDYSARWPGPQYWRLNAVRPLLHSELGVPGEASLATQERYLSPVYRDRSPSNPARRHHGGAWWDHEKTITGVFGPVADPALGVLASQWLQAEGLRYYIEASRRRWPHTAGIYPWQLNEPWPNVVCTSAVEYGGRPKPAYFAVRQAYAPVVVCAQYAALRLEPGEPLRVAVWVLNDGPALEAPLTVVLHDLAGTLLPSPAPAAVSVAETASTAVADLALPLPPDFTGVVVLDLAWGPARNRYLFSNHPEAPLRETLAVPNLLRGMFVADPPVDAGIG
ncbi:MAG TPA: glycoside hydrolase family 2 TIM barrel-domain containing protein [Chloroflexia bacterium]|nr:glycoside hydrolase family 2 TIM barrel-domain containing protein [Chloroflexia bacterium]